MRDLRQLRAWLERYDLTGNEAAVYIHLLRVGSEVSVLQIARALKMGRTPVYNALDRLQDKGLVSRRLADNGNNFAATSPDNLEKYWQSRQARLERMGGHLPGLIASLEGVAAPVGYKSQVNYFAGREGLEQMTYNSLRAEGDLYIYEMQSSMGAFVSQETAERFRRVWVERGTRIHQMTNLTRVGDFTEVEQLTWLWDIRYIDPEILRIEFETLIYNDVVAMYSYGGGEVFGVEIRNQALAKMQKQIFVAMQALARPLEIRSPRGVAELV